MKVITLTAPRMMAQARVLAGSLEREHPEWSLEILVLGRWPAAEAGGGPASVRTIDTVLDVNLERLLARHGTDEATRLLLGPVLARYGERREGPLLHLPPTAWILGGLEPVQEALERSSVLLVPRTLTDVPDDGLQPTREDLESAGRVSDTIIGVDGTAAGKGFLHWYGELTEQALGSLDGERRGARPEDRPWLARLLELAPARFGAAVLDDPGSNVSLWNLHERSLEQSEDGVLVNRHWALRFMDLPGFQVSRPYRLSALASRARVSRSPALRELSERYAVELQAAGALELDRSRDIGRRLAGGLLYDAPLHALRQLAEALGESYPELFEEHDSRAFEQWLKAPAPEGAEHGITRYVYCRVARERPDVMRAYPHLDGPDGAAYVQWCWGFGREELAIPERFMAPRPGAAVAPAQRSREDATPAEPRPVREGAARVEPGASRQEAARAEPGRTGEGAAPAEPIPAPTTGARAAARGESEQPAPPGNGRAPSVRITGYLGHSLGLGAAARGYAQALEADGVPVSTVSVPLHHLELPVELDHGYGLHGFQERSHGLAANEVEIVAVNADELPAFVERLGPGYFHGPRIGVWGWETDSIPPRWQRAFELVDEIWVYSRFMAQNIGAVAPVPVVALPPPVQAPVQPPAPLRLDLPGGDFLYLFVFDYLSTIERKNPVGLIEAFKRAFAPGEGPRLLIKTINAPLRPLAEEALLWSAAGRTDIHVIDRSLSAEQRDALMAGCDCYISLHRSEGFGLTLAEAMAIGKPVIGTGYSGNLDFMSEDNSYLVDYELTRVGPECEIYPPDGKWAEPSLEHAAALMRGVYEHREEAARRADRAREDIASGLCPQATGAAMSGRLRELLARNAGERRPPLGVAN